MMTWCKHINWKMISLVRRCSSLARNQVRENNESIQSHIYDRFAFNNIQELINLLVNNVVFKQDGLIVLNKPYGLKKEQTELLPQKNNLITMQPAIEKTNHLSFTCVLSPLAKELKEKHLTLVKVPERYISGVALMSNNDIVQRKIKKNFGNASLPLYTYLAVCIGIPIKLSDRSKLGLMIREKNNTKKSILVQNYSKRSVQERIIVPVTMIHDTLAINESLNVSLVRIQNNRNKWHAVRAFCGLRLLAPILGDTYYNSCVRQIDGKALLIDPLSALANFPTKLPTKLLSALELLRSKNEIMIPTHLHLSGVNLQKLQQGKIFVARPSEHFLWTCDKLNLTIPDVYLQNGLVEENTYFIDPTK